MENEMKFYGPDKIEIPIQVLQGVECLSDDVEDFIKKMGFVAFTGDGFGHADFDPEVESNLREWYTSTIESGHRPWREGIYE